MSDHHVHLDANPDQAVRLETRLKEPYFTKDGALYPMTDAMGWHEVPTREKGTCEHCETACSECVDTWAIDHHVRPTLPGGRTYGLNGVPGHEPLDGPTPG